MPYSVSEVFYSFQGEGFLQGLPMVFVRLSGCNLRCHFCDTKYAFKNGKHLENVEIFELIKGHGCKRICITGGEPFMQELSPLAELLKKKGYWLTAETNGTLWQKPPLDWLTVSPKREGKGICPEGYDKRFLETASEFKYVITDRKDFDFIDRQIKQPVILQPVNNNLQAARIISEFMLKNPGHNWYLRFQNHKIAGVK
ncbi:MAG TPA: 7-carboxy-7-deazaguanine synthase QueE [bacterium]|nr:7-carboxy-7-deazaguanine synthase QueE [bacterium]